MSVVKQGNYEVTISATSTDEIGNLIITFKSLIEHINHLINEVLQAKINQQKYELEVLQAQINPHFLYNSLSLINRKAIMTQQTDISKMAQLLSTFYRTMLNKGMQITTISAELENIKAYISIQQLLHSYSFDVIYDIDNNLLETPIPNFLLQPLAENAILHGLDQKLLPGKKILSLTCYTEENDVIIKIMDNGCGMKKEDCKKILLTDSQGYGIKNVHQRIQLYYGKNYGLLYHSTVGIGTYVLVRIAKELTC